ncbi:MAG: FG-GAP repeat protein [Phycisphaerales bacterium]|nr:FG-GAP repeat protein [Phycisphaerales bacterium]
MFNNAFANSVRSAPAFSFALAAAALTLLTGTALARNTLASGDFDNDGFMDLVIGIPGENVQTVSNAGAVEVFFGSGVALTVLGDQYRHQNKPGFNDQTEVNDLFGNAVAVGDFNNDGFDDLAIGIPFEDVSGVVDAGAIAVIYGDASGVLSPDDQFWHQDSHPRHSLTCLLPHAPDQLPQSRQPAFHPRHDQLPRPIQIDHVGRIHRRLRSDLLHVGGKPIQPGHDSQHRPKLGHLILHVDQHAQRHGDRPLFRNGLSLAGAGIPWPALPWGRRRLRYTRH